MGVGRKTRFLNLRDDERYGNDHNPLLSQIFRRDLSDGHEGERGLMSTFFLSPLTLPIASVPAFIALAGPEESAREGLSGQTQMGLDMIYEADGQ